MNFGEKPYLIAETAYIHEGNVDYLFSLMEEMNKDCCDAVKFHLLFNIESYIASSHPLYNMIKKWLFDEKVWRDIFNLVRNKDLDLVVLVDDVESVKFLYKYCDQIKHIELHASGVWDVKLQDAILNYLKNTSMKSIILGIGGLSVEEIGYLVNKFSNFEVILAYGYQSYPTDYKKINLRKIVSLQNLFGDVKILYADHTSWDDPLNIILPIVAYTLGAQFIEKHVTLEPGVKRIDYESAISIKQLAILKDYMEKIYESFGSNSMFEVSSDELAYAFLRKVPVASRKIKEGEVITLENIDFKRIKDIEYKVRLPIDVLLEQYIGRRTKKVIDEDEEINPYKLL